MASAVPSASAAPPKELPEYKAPLGLTWGQSPKEAKALLSKRLTFRREYPTDNGATIEQSYGGQFAGVDTQMVGVDFSPSAGLIAVAAMYPAADDRPASKRWLDVVDKMRADYGDPTKFSAPPKTQAEAAAVAAEAYPDTPNKAKIATLLGASTIGRYDELDIKIVKGEWTPSAVWEFSNAMVLVLVNDTRDANSKHSLKVNWMFMTKDSMTKIAKSRPKDF